MPTWYLILALAFIAVNGLFVAAEYSLVKVRPTQLAELDSARARMSRHMQKRMESYLPAAQVGVTLASLALGWVGEPAFASLLLPVFRNLGIFAEPIAHSISATLAFIVISSLHIVFGEQVPKFLALSRPVGTTLWTSHMLHAFYLFTFPAIWLLSGLTNGALRILRIRPRTEGAVESQEELRLILASSEKAGILSEENREIIEGVFQFSKRTARQIMVPRTDVSFLSTARTIAENLEIIGKTRHTRYPLCDGTLDQTIGLIHVKDLLLAQLKGPGRPLEQLKRDMLFVPENSTVETLLAQFIEHKTHMAVVLDEYGGASGIVSLENITEELFGQIQDEFDRERPEIEPLGNGRYRVRGDYLIEDLADRLKIDLGEPAEETIGGYVQARLGREVHPGDRVELGDMSIEVVEAERYRVRWVILQTRMPTEEIVEEIETMS